MQIIIVMLGWRGQADFQFSLVDRTRLSITTTWSLLYFLSFIYTFLFIV